MCNIVDKHSNLFMITNFLFQDCEDHANEEVCKIRASTCKKALWTRKNCKKYCNLC